MQKGFGLNYLLIGVLILGAIGGSYYLETKKPVAHQISKQNTVDKTASWQTYTEKFSKSFSVKYPEGKDWIGSGYYYYEYGNPKGLYSCAALGNAPASGNGSFSEEQLKQIRESTAVFICYSSQPLPSEIPTESESHLLYKERSLVNISARDFKPYELNGYLGYKASVPISYYPSQTEDVIYLKNPKGGYAVIIGEGKNLDLIYEIISTFKFN